MPDRGDLAGAIAAHLAEWETAHVELAIYGTQDSALIAGAIRDFCRAQLGTEVVDTLFYQSSIGAVAGLVLADGRRVVLKAHQPDAGVGRLGEIVRLQRYLAERNCFAPTVLAGPAPLVHGLGTIEPYNTRGDWADPHLPGIRDAIARGLWTLVETLGPLIPDSTLPPHPLFDLPPGRLWPKPHSSLFDFEATVAGAADIDAVATAALANLGPAGRIVLGHCDWRAEHLRFEGTTPVVAYDWDSLVSLPEAALLGFTAHAFCADWSREDHVQAPSLDEARAFVRAYEQARGCPFETDERRLCGAAFAYSVAYTARCGHALGVDERLQPGRFQHLIAAHGPALQALFS